MILKQHARTYESTGKNVDVVLKQHNIPIVMDLLINRMYVNKHKSTIRELICNGLDAGASKVKVDLEPIGKYCKVTITDDGEGMSLEKIEQVYCSFADSDKRNDDALIGGFGIGSKSPLSISEAFTVTTRTKTEHTVFTVAMNGDKMPVVSILEHEKAEEGKKFYTGTKIEFVCEDAYAMRYPGVRSEKVFLNSVCLWFDIKKITRSVGICLSPDAFNAVTGYSYGGVYVLYGDAVVYELPKSQERRIKERLKRLGFNGMVRMILEADVSELTPVPSREYLEDSKENHKFFDKIEQELDEYVNSVVEELKRFPFPEILLTLYLTADSGTYGSSVATITNIELPFGDDERFSYEGVKSLIARAFDEAYGIDLNPLSEVKIRLKRNDVKKILPVYEYALWGGEYRDESKTPLILISENKKNFYALLHLINGVLTKLGKPMWRPNKVYDMEPFLKRKPKSFISYVPACPSSPTWITFEDTERFADNEKAVWVPDFYAKKSLYLYAFSAVWENFDKYVTRSMMPYFVVSAEVYKKLPQKVKMTYDELWETYPKKMQLFVVLKRLAKTFSDPAPRQYVTPSIRLYEAIKKTFFGFSVDFFKRVHPELGRDFDLKTENCHIGKICGAIDVAFDASRKYIDVGKGEWVDEFFSALNVPDEPFGYDPELFVQLYKAFVQHVPEENLDANRFVSIFSEAVKKPIDKTE